MPAPSYRGHECIVPGGCGTRSRVAGCAKLRFEVRVERQGCGGPTVPMFLASYELPEDVPGAHGPFLTRAQRAGWLPWVISDDGLVYRLPSGTLKGTFVDRAAAETALKKSLGSANALLGTRLTFPKWIIVDYGSSSFGSDVIKT